jgi:hypothetical protein
MESTTSDGLDILLAFAAIVVPLLLAWLLLAWPKSPRQPPPPHRTKK